jgi:tetratricopeptide (TPR) repeat protein
MSATSEERAKHWKAALALDPAAVPARFPLGAQLLNEGLVSEAEAVFLEGIRATPKEPVLSYGLAQVRQAQGKRREAIKAYREALRLDPAYPDARRELGLTLLELGDKAQARKELEAAVRRNPSDTEAARALDSLSEP